MKLRLYTPGIAVIAALLLLASCSSKKNIQGKRVPKDAGFVLHFNSKSMFEKLNVADLKQTDWYRQMVEQLEQDSTTPDFVKNLHENMGSSGVDSAADVIFFGQKDPKNQMNVVLEGGIMDAKAFESFATKMYPQGNIIKAGEIQTMVLMDHAVLTWNKDRFVMGMIPHQRANRHELPNNSDDSTGTTRINGIEDLTAYCKNLYSLREDNSLGSDEKFSDLMSTGGDIHVWISVENLLGGDDLPLGALNMIKLDAFTKGTIATFTANFENGRISVKTKCYFGKELSDIFKKYSGGNFNTDMIKNIPSQNVVAVLALHFKPEGLRAMVDLSGVGAIIDLILLRQGFSVDDFVKANKGDLLVAFTDLQKTQQPDTSSGHQADISIPSEKTVRDNLDAKVLFSAAINDKEAFNKLINVGKTSIGTNDKLHYKSNGNYFVIGNDSNVVDQYLAGGKDDQPFLNQISGSSVGGFADIQKILRALPPDAVKDSLIRQMSDESLKMWDNAVLTGGNYSNGGFNLQLELNLSDKNTNSLRQLLQYTMVMSRLERKKIKDMEPGKKLFAVNTDTTTTFNELHRTPIGKKKK